MSSLLEKSFLPAHALVIYKKKGSGHNEGQETYLESYDIVQGNNTGFIFSDAKPLPYEVMREIASNFKEREEAKKPKIIQSRGLIHDRLVFFRPEGSKPFKMIWDIPSQKRMMYFSEQADVGILEAEVTYPRMLFVVMGNYLSVFALRVKSKIDLNTKLFIAPFMNCGEKGGVCLGSASLKITPQNTEFMEEIMAGAENAFFNSRFSHSGAGNVKMPIKDFWRSMANGDLGNKFPEDQLLPSVYTMPQLLV